MCYTYIHGTCVLVCVSCAVRMAHLAFVLTCPIYNCCVSLYLFYPLIFVIRPIYNYSALIGLNCCILLPATMHTYFWYENWIFGFRLKIPLFGRTKLAESCTFEQLFSMLKYYQLLTVTVSLYLSAWRAGGSLFIRAMWPWRCSCCKLMHRLLPSILLLSI